MKQNIFLLLALLATACTPGKHLPLTENDMGGYLLVFFTDPTHGLFMATSRDGYTFTAVNDGQPVIAGDTIADQKGIRDPHITRGPDGAFYLAMTDLHIFGQQRGYRDTPWERDGDAYGWGNNRGFVLMKSVDLIHWTRSNVRVDEAFPGLDVGCAWAPETIYDAVAGKMMIYFTMRLGNGKTKLYYAYTDDAFTRLETEPRLLFEYPDPAIQILDADITPLPDGRFCMMYVVQENPGGIKLAISDSIHGGYVYAPEQVDFEPRSCEAPNVWKRVGEEKWVLMYDVFSIQPHNFGFCETTDFKTFTNLGRFNEGVMKTTNFSSPKHGAVIQITEKELERLTRHWNTATTETPASKRGAKKTGYAGYLFAYFEGSGQKQEQLRFALSADALDWHALNNNEPVIASESISSSGGIRDPHILRGEDGKTFYMVATDMMSSKGWDSNRAMILMKSTDLLNWTSSIVNIQQQYPGQEALKRVWAPQTIYDREAGKYMIYWSMKHGDGPDIIYYSYASADFSGLETAPRQFFFPKNGRSCIDGDIVYKEGLYYLFYKTEGDGNGIKLATSPSLASGQWDEKEGYKQLTNEAVEGSSVFKLNDSDTYILMYDVYRKGEFHFVQSKDLEHFTAIDKPISMNFHPRHGSVISVTKKEVERLQQHWGAKH
jgi:hypothetical protein